MHHYQPRDFGAEYAEQLTSPFVNAIMSGYQNREQEFANMRKMQEESRLQKLLEEQKYQYNRGLQEQEYDLKGNIEKQKQQQQGFEDIESLKDIEMTFGPTFAKIYKAAPMGGRTELIKNAIDAKQRNIDLEKVLAPYKNQPLTPEAPKEEKEYPDINEFQGLNRKEEFNLRKEFRHENKDIFKDSTDKLAGYKSEQRLLNVLEELNPDLPEGLERTLINPSTGEPYALAQLTEIVPPKVQRFVKTVNDFTTKAKDTFGSRVTNFDLERFMSRLPSLLNTKDGRGQIIKQMKLINDINRLYYGTLKGVYQNYGLDNISQERAEEITENIIKDDVADLESQFSQIDQNQIVEMVDENGEVYDIPQNLTESAKSKGLRLK